MIVLVVAAGTLWPARSFAQSGGLGYALTGPMNISAFGDRTRGWSIGGGGERIRGNGGAGGEFEWVYSPADCKTEYGYRYCFRSAQFVVASANGYHHFNGGASRTRVRPFIGGGGGLAFVWGDCGGLPVGNVGGGIDMWKDEHVGLRIEARDQLAATPYGLYQLSFSIRVGLLFR
jgi:hypothetical protein